MRKKLFIGLGAFAALLVIFLIVVAMQPSDFRISRSLAMSAPPAAIFPHVNELKKWQPWSPWMKLDPNARSTFEGPEGGKGAVMTWAGNNEVGEGRMTILESKPNELIRFRNRDTNLDSDVGGRLRILRERVESALEKGRQLEL